MPGYLCEECEETIPRARFCPECELPTMLGILPQPDSDGPIRSQWYSDGTLNAHHESVSFDKLRSKHDSYERPLGAHIDEDEQPEAIFEVKKCTIEGVDGSSWKISAGVLDSGHLIATDKRVVALFPRKEGPQIIAVQFTDIVGVDGSSSWRSNKLKIEDLEGYQYTYSLDVDEETFETLTELVRELNEEVDSEDSSAAKFLNQIDNEIASAEDAETALRSIADVFENRSEKTNFDQAVAEANSIDELVDRMTAIGGLGTQKPEPTQSGSETSLVKPTVSLTSLQQRISETARGADPKDVGKYSLGAVLGFGAYAVSAPFSTTAGIATLLASGAATGAYASTHPDSMAARIDPIQLAMRAKSRGSQINSNSTAGGYGSGAALGTAEYLSQMDHNNIDEAYARWLSQVDIDSIIDGQKAASRYARQSDELGGPKQASILGGAAGLAYGYADMDEDVNIGFDDDVDGILDETDNSDS